MKTKLFLAVATLTLLAFTALPAEAHKIKRNCLWGGNNIFRVHAMCRDGNSQPRATPSRSVTPDKPTEPDKPQCKDDKGKNYGKDKD